MRPTVSPVHAAVLSLIVGNSDFAKVIECCPRCDTGVEFPVRSACWCLTAMYVFGLKVKQSHDRLEQALRVPGG
jgi:hypothetical protein